jgi:hypothetical protein
MVIELRRVCSFRTLRGWRRQMVIDPADYGDTMQLPGGLQEVWGTRGDGCPDRAQPVLEILQGKYLVTCFTTVGDSNE